MTEKEQAIVDRLHDSEFEMLCKLDDVCRKYDITYFLEAGTLIGAARHKDFVPWDDDIDIYFKRKDFEKLMEHKDEFDPYFIHVPNAEDNFFWDYTARLMNDRVWLKKNDREARFYEHTHCQYQFIDLFVMDNIRSGLAGKMHIFQLKLLYVFGTSKRYKLKYDKPANPISRFAVFMLCRMGMFMSLKWLFETYDKVSQRYNNKKCEYYLLSNVAATYIDKSIYKKKWYKTRTELPVRGRNFYVPGEYQESLRSYYGDYMQLPPEEMRYPDHVESFDDVVFLDDLEKK